MLMQMALGLSSGCQMQWESTRAASSARLTTTSVPSSEWSFSVTAARKKQFPATANFRKWEIRFYSAARSILESRSTVLHWGNFLIWNQRQRRSPSFRALSFFCEWFAFRNGKLCCLATFRPSHSSIATRPLFLC